MIISTSAVNSLAVTKSDSTEVDCEALYIGGAGDLVIKHTSTSATVTYSGLTAGTVLPVRLRKGRVMAATTATLIVAMSV